ncbi:MAG: AgmX/PglI C-terminal domain-containing protein [Polyangiaceae bacterium]|nr:AgmX/PglI C-terminal domain-containing protein [Polyangiaceae bacterium]
MNKGKMSQLSLAAFGMAVCALSACGGGKDPEVAPPPVATATNRSMSEKRPKMQMKGELGSIDEKVTNELFQSMQPALNSCYTQARGKLNLLQGDVKFFVRVAETGGAKYVVLEQSTLGDRTAENCMLDLLKGAKWPAPDGGEAEVRKGYGFDPPGNVRPPVEWGPDKLVPAIAKIEKDIEKCKSGATGMFKVTAYVRGDGKHGKFDAIGISPPNQEGESHVNCILDVLHTLTASKLIPSPGSYPAKVQFQL